MEFINLPKRKKIKLGAAELELLELPLAEYFEIIRQASGLPASAPQLAQQIDRFVVSGKLETLTASEFSLFIKELAEVNDPGKRVKFPKLKHKKAMTPSAFTDAVFSLFAEAVAAEYGKSPLEIFREFSARQLLIYFALAYNRKTPKSEKAEDAEKIYVEGIPQEVQSLPIDVQAEYYEKKYIESMEKES